jgi:mono/diheme cytochrome c family protein
MKKILRIVLVLFILLAVSISSLVAYIKLALPDVGPAPDLTIEATPERLARGEYLANAVVGCNECHAKRDFTKFAGPIEPNTFGRGGELFGVEMGFPGNYYAPNITPYGIGNWTDGELFRAITSGVSKDGRALFPIMPYPHFAKMDKEDIYAIIAYIRTLEPIEYTAPKSETTQFPVTLLINTMPQPATFSERPPKEELIKYGEYITNAAICMDCHTQQVKGQYQMDKYMAGGFEFPMPSGGTVRSANITPDAETGIGAWTEEQFLSRFKTYADSTYTPAEVSHGALNTMMPWGYYSKMKDEDLKAIFAYLKSLPPIKNEVEKFTPPTN